jgi:acetyl esterase/lipase
MMFVLLFFKLLASLLLLFLFLVLPMTIYLFIRVKKRDKEVSVSGAIMNAFYYLFKPKNFPKIIYDQKRSDKKLCPSEKFSNKYIISYKIIDNDEFITASNNDPNDIHLIYLHGGAYILGKSGMKSREAIISQLIDNTNSKVTFFDYPVAPESNYKNTLKAVHVMYLYLLKNYNQDRFMFIGDSAGGGLSLAFSQMIKNEMIKKPEKLILYSPWIDISMSNPEIKKFEKFDMLLTIKDLLNAAKLYAGIDELKNSLVSPIYGDFENLGDILLFSGTHELLYADVLKLQKMKTKANITFSIYPKMQHVWILAPIKETTQALNQTYEFILE